MEEKERYELQIDYKGNRFFCDTYKNIDYKLSTEICDLLNQQEKRIKELEKENSSLSQGLYWWTGEKLCNAVKRLDKENQQLKQQLDESEKRYKKAYQEGLLQKQFDKDMEIIELKHQLSEYKDICHKHHIDCPANLDRILLGIEQQVEELKGKRLEFYNDEVMQTQVINGVHFNIEQLLVFSEYVEYEKNIRDDKNKQINQLKQQLHDLPKKIVCEISESIERLSWRKRIYTNWEFDKEQLYKDLDTILKKYGGENESK